MVLIIIFNYFTGKFTLPRVPNSREPMVKLNFQFPEIILVYSFIVFSDANARFFFTKTSLSGSLLYLVVPRDVR